MAKTVTENPDGTTVTTFSGVDLQTLKDNLAEAAGLGKPEETPEGCCRGCKQPFTEKNVFTAAGWRETRITQLCEACWDEMFSEE